MVHQILAAWIEIICDRVANLLSGQNKNFWQESAVLFLEKSFYISQKACARRTYMIFVPANDTGVNFSLGPCNGLGTYR